MYRTAGSNFNLFHSAENDQAKTMLNMHKKLIKIGCLVLEVYSCADKQTNMVITILHSLTGGEAIIAVA